MNLLFDFGGVLVDLDKECCRRAFAALGFDIMPYLGTYAQAGFFSALERGELSVHEFCTALRQAAGNPALGDDDIVGAWREYLRGVPRERQGMCSDQVYLHDAAKDDADDNKRSLCASQG